MMDKLMLKTTLMGDKNNEADLDLNPQLSHLRMTKEEIELQECYHLAQQRLLGSKTILK